MHASALIALASLLAISAHPQPRTAPELRSHPHLAHRAVSPRHHRRDIDAASGAAKGHLGFPPPFADNDLHEAPTNGKRMARKRKRNCAVSTGGSNSTTPSTTQSSSNGTPAASSSSVADESAPSASASATPDNSGSSNSTSPSAGGGASGNAVFPVGSGSASWTTDTDMSGALSFTDALKPLSSGHLPDTVSAPDGSQALSATYPAGIVGLKNGGGMNFYTEGNKNGVNVEGATEVTFTYSVFFPDDFDFVKGGKLPGVYGGTSLDNAKSCSGGRQDDRQSCFSARTMWRTDGMGEIYNYLPSGAADAYPGYCSTAPMSLCNPDYGDSIGRGAFTFPKGQWTTVAQRFKMNDFGQSNGEQELYVNGESKISIKNMAFAQEEGTQIYGIMSQSFFVSAQCLVEVNDADHLCRVVALQTGLPHPT